MPKNVGRYQQGDRIEKSAVAPDEAGVPTKAPQAGPTPKGRQHEKDPKRTYPANRIAAH